MAICASFTKALVHFFKITEGSPGARRRPGPSVLLFTGLLATAATAPLAAADGWKVYWKNGTRVESEDGKLELKFGGRLQLDFAFDDSGGELARAFTFEDGSELRRGRLFFEGTLYERVEFKVQYDFAGGEALPKDLYVGLVDLPVVGNLRVGHVKEPFGLEELTSAKYVTFLERSAPTEAFVPDRNVGLMLFDTAADQRVTWAAGIFQDSDELAHSSGGNWNLTGRVTGLPQYQDEGRHLVHLGVDYSLRDPTDDTVRFRARPEVHLAPRLVDTGSIAATSTDLFDLEAATVQGPFWAQAEWMSASTGSPSSADLSGVTVQAGWFLTGESRAYSRSVGAFDRIKPKSELLKEGGHGAWEVAIRYSQLDLDDHAVSGGEQDSTAVAVNWYPNSATRLMLDYVTTSLDGTGGSADFLLLRFGVDF